MNYTKGEWRVEGKRIYLHSPGWSNDRKVIADCNQWLDTESEANAHLIATAPRMADLLQRLVTDGWNASISEEAKEILALATGEVKR